MADIYISLPTGNKCIIRLYLLNVSLYEMWKKKKKKKISSGVKVLRNYTQLSAHTLI